MKQLGLPPAFTWRTVASLSFLCLVLSGSPQAVAQPEGAEPAEALPTGEKKIWLGFTAGLTFANYYGDTVALRLNSKRQMGPIMGLRATILLGDGIKSRFYFTPELLFQMRGTRREEFIRRTFVFNQNIPGLPFLNADLDSSSIVRYSENLGYLQVPLLLRADFGEHGLRPYFSLGPVIGYNLWARTTRKEILRVERPILVNGSHVPDPYGIPNADGEITTPLTTLEERETETTTAIQNINPVDIGAIIAAGATFTVGSNMRLVAEGRYDISFHRLYVNEGIKTRNSSLAFMLGLEF